MGAKRDYVWHNGRWVGGGMKRQKGRPSLAHRFFPSSYWIFFYIRHENMRTRSPELIPHINLFFTDPQPCFPAGGERRMVKEWRVFL